MRGVRGVFPRAGDVRDAAERARSTTAWTSNSTWRPCSPAWPGRSVRRTGSTCPTSARRSASSWAARRATAATARAATARANVTPSISKPTPSRRRHAGPPPAAPAATDTGAGMVANGGKQLGETVGHSEMITNRPTATPADLLEETHEPEFQQRRHAGGSRQRAHRVDHQLHEHVQPERDARRGAAGEEGGRARPARRSGRENVARARLARRDRLPGQKRVAALSRPARFPDRRLRLHDVHRQLRPAASEDRGSHHRARSHRGVRAERQPQFRGARASEHQGEFPHVAAAGRGVRAGGPRGSRPVHRSHRQGHGRRRTCTCATSGRASHEIRQAMAAALKPEVFRQLYSDFAEQNPKWNEIPSTAGGTYAWDEESDYIQEPPFFLDFSMEPGHIAEIKGARPLGHFRRFGDDRPHLARRARSRPLHRRVSTSSRAASSRRISIPTAAAAATTR